MYLQPFFHSMHHRNYACVIDAKGCKLTVTHPFDWTSIFDFLNITDFWVITDIQRVFFNFTGFRHFWGRNWRCAYNNRVPVRGASKRGHENEFCTKFWGSWRPYFRCSSSKTEKTCIYSHACTACSIGTARAFVDLKVSNWPKHTQSIEKWFGTIWI